MPVDADGTRAALVALASRLTAAGEVIANTGALRVQALGMGLTRVETGTTRRSWRTMPAVGDGGSWSASVGPTTIYARRLELGFLPPLVDSLGRSFPNDRGRPYVRPAAYASRSPILSMAQQIVAEAVRGG